MPGEIDGKTFTQVLGEKIAAVTPDGLDILLIVIEQSTGRVYYVSSVEKEDGLKLVEEWLARRRAELRGTTLSPEAPGRH